MNRTEIAIKAEDIKTNIDRLDLLLDSMNDHQAQALDKVYESINIVLRAQYEMIRNKTGLKVVGD